MQSLLEFFESSLRNHFNAKSQYLSLFSQLGIAPEGWFRGEILYILSYMPDIAVLKTNQEVHSVAGRPDFFIRTKDQKLLLELKVLPVDRNYPYGWQRFLAGGNNKKDFEMLRDKKRHGIIYVYWPDVDDWNRLKNKLRSKYGVTCAREFEIQIKRGFVIFSLWLHTQYSIERGGAPNTSL